MATPRHGGEIILEMAQFDARKTGDGAIPYNSSEKNGSASAGERLAVSLNANMEVSLCGDGDAIVGRLEKVDPQSMATVVVHAIRLRYKGGDGATLTRGGGIVGDLGDSDVRGYVRSPAATVAESIKSKGTIIDSDGTNPVLMFSSL